MLGCIIGAFSIMYILSAVVSGKYLSKIGKASGLKFGMLFIVVQLFGLGSLKYIASAEWFIALSILAQCFGGVGAGMNTTCAIAIITNHYPRERELNLGILESGTGLGLLLGPVVGAILYAVGGYVAPFWTVGVVCLLLLPLLQHTVTVINKEEQIKHAKAIVQHYVDKVNPDDIRVEITRHRKMKSEDLSPTTFFKARFPTEEEAKKVARTPMMF